MAAHRTVTLQEGHFIPAAVRVRWIWAVEENVCSIGWKLNLVINIKRELALLRQMLPDARITGCFYPDGSGWEPANPSS